LGKIAILKPYESPSLRPSTPNLLRSLGTRLSNAMNNPRW
jgi:hypothetical protein